jgi:hypothetical protein
MGILLFGKLNSKCGIGRSDTIGWYFKQEAEILLSFG